MEQRVEWEVNQWLAKYSTLSPLKMSSSLNSVHFIEYIGSPKFNRLVEV